MKTLRIKALALGLSLTTLTYLTPNTASAHCDTMDGPVVKAAEKALATGNVNLVLLWVQTPNEPQIRHAFERALSVRKLGIEAKELADRYFFETLVRIHRAGEGAPYTGLKPAGTDLGEAVPEADKALATKDAAPLLAMLSNRMDAGLKTRFRTAAERAEFAPNDVAAGREYVRAYVEFVHYVEGVHEALSAGGHGHAEKTKADSGGHPGPAVTEHGHK
ncbi:MAG TPA: DUF6448 family protein [Clostridia bacterium]|nr:DUF6448 family protein [Clostridia bacterium]